MFVKICIMGIMTIHLVLKESSFGEATAIAVDIEGKTLATAYSANENALRLNLEREIVSLYGLDVEFVNHINKTVPAWLLSKIRSNDAN